MSTYAIRPSRILFGLMLLIAFCFALIMAAPGSAYAAVPEIIDGSQYPENGAVGVPSALEYVRVSFKSNPKGEVDGSNNPVNYLPIKKDNPGGTVKPNWEKIRVIELSTNTQVQAVNASGQPEVWFDDGSASNTDATLVIKVNKYLTSGSANDNQKRLKPGETYQVIIPQGSLEYENDGASADRNAEISWTFTVERKPIPAVFSFQPGNQTFTVKNGISTLPNRVDIQGVGYRKSLVMEFMNDMKSNFDQNTVVVSGNELSASATPHTPQTEISLDGNSANTLIIKLPNDNPLKPNHLYTVTINSNNLEDAESDTQIYFAQRGSNVTTPVKPATVTEASAISYANEVIRFAYDYIYAYLPTTQAASYEPANSAAGLANQAQFLIDRVRSFSTLSTEVNNLETAVNNFIATTNTPVANNTYATSAAAATGATNAKYPLKNDSVTIKFSTFRDFKATLIDPQTATIANINNTILSIEPPRRIAVVVPKSYIKNIETIHYVQGLVPSMQGNNLTNIDITADIDVAKIVVTSNRGPRILTNKINNVFTAGYSGLEADGLTEVKLQAFDKYGQILEERNFKLGVDGTNPVKNDYMPKESKALGKTYTLYELMADPKLFAEILQHYPVSRLSELGIFLPYTP
ncbi:hypothetical protein [Paenibacillus alkalitolerans]|uniref:hypothetical protein n=1 Tax=Paenibacillus alkalitolerans TaxID=2799335 RepID=UPI0018F321E9|nr:hypothetical protein [Paenibacillus alkalitolerans]